MFTKNANVYWLQGPCFLLLHLVKFLILLLQFFYSFHFSSYSFLNLILQILHLLSTSPSHSFIISFVLLHLSPPHPPFSSSSFNFSTSPSFSPLPQCSFNLSSSNLCNSSLLLLLFMRTLKIIGKNQVTALIALVYTLLGAEYVYMNMFSITTTVAGSVCTVSPSSKVYLVVPINLSVHKLK